VTSVLKVFHYDVCDLLILDATFSLVNPYVAMIFGVGTEIPSNPFHVTTHVGNTIAAK